MSILKQCLVIELHRQAYLDSRMQCVVNAACIHSSVTRALLHSALTLHLSSHLCHHWPLWQFPRTKSIISVFFFHGVFTQKPCFHLPCRPHAKVYQTGSPPLPQPHPGLLIDGQGGRCELSLVVNGGRKQTPAGLSSGHALCMWRCLRESCVNNRGWPGSGDGRARGVDCC